MDHKQQLQQYITENLAHGYTKDQVVQSLQQAGWPLETIDQAFTQEQTQPLPQTPMPVPQVNAAPAKLLKKPLTRELIAAFVLGLISVIVLKLMLPSPEQQLINAVMAELSDSIFPAILFPLLIVVVVLSVVYGVVLKFAMKFKHVFPDLLFVSFMAVFLALTVAQDRVVETGFLVALLVTFPLSQLIWGYARKLLVLRIVFIVALVGLFIVSGRVLNTGGIF